MIKMLNIFSFLILLIVSLLSLFSYHDDMDVKIPFITTIFISLSIILGLTLFLKINLRWQALSLSLKQKGYAISKNGFRNAIVYELINIIFYLLVGGALTFYIHQIWFVGIIILLHFAEGVAHLTINAIYNPYKIIITSTTVMVITNKVEFVKWSSIKKIETKHNDIHLVDKLNKTHILDLDLLSSIDAKLITKQLKEIAIEKDLYCSLLNK